MVDPPRRQRRNIVEENRCARNGVVFAQGLKEGASGARAQKTKLRTAGRTSIDVTRSQRPASVPATSSGESANLPEADWATWGSEDSYSVRARRHLREPVVSRSQQLLPSPSARSLPPSSISLLVKHHTKLTTPPFNVTRRKLLEETTLIITFVKKTAL